MNERILPSWRNGSTRDAIVGFLDQADDIAPRDRVAVFDNDGTMWAEKPKYTQLEFWLLELKRALAESPDLAAKPEFEAVLAGDEAAIQAIGIEDVVRARHEYGVATTGVGDDKFVAGMLANDESNGEAIGVPKVQKRVPAPPLELLASGYATRDAGIVAAYATGEYSYQQIGQFYGLHFTSVGNIVRRARRRGKAD